MGDGSECRERRYTPEHRNGLDAERTYHGVIFLLCFVARI